MLRRKGSFFGLHFDFHASPGGCPRPIGETLREEDIREICRDIAPDFLQIDCKGHPGWASYPTECGNAMPDQAIDTLALWRRVTAEEGVALYMHYSGMYDANYCSSHPDQAVTNPDGSRSDSSTRANGRYAEDLLIPQLCELAGKYGVDGVWVDGDCWYAFCDWAPETLAEFERTRGIKLEKFPTDRGDEYFEEYREYCRELYRDYLRRYVNAVHEKYPNFQICSNWAFSDHMPEPVCADVDFISGDLSPENSFNSARYAARAIAQQGLPWDLMSWNFRHPSGIPKHPVQIMQEAAAVISVGGGFQNYITQLRDGSPRMDQIRPMKGVAEFIRARQPYCQGVKPIHQAAVLLSTYDRHRESSGLFSRNGMERAMGATCVLCDVGHSTEIISEHTLHGHAADYPVIVIPELYVGLAPETVAELLDYAANGGSLLLLGRNTCRIFSEAGAPFGVEPCNSRSSYFTLDGSVRSTVSDICYLDGGRPLASAVAGTDLPLRPIAVLTQYGKGRIAAAGFDLGSQYLALSQYLLRDLVKAILNELYTPQVTLERSNGLLEITLTQKDGRRLIQLVNPGGNHASARCGSEDSIPPVTDIVLSVACGERPETVTLRPENKELPFEYSNGRAAVRLDRLDLHSIIDIK